ncbi:MAG: lysine--tRNA ligase [Thaumarchaeota archaeon]|nr:lysine--tRNA ligase [Candidatus Calditenuaceae archaeon]MDW8042518.1 lysine--tRNA ligase [Nitrososphaerota archaeon]
MRGDTTTKKVIGRGTWMDMVAHRIAQRERDLGRSLRLIRTESGFGASGIPHIGSMADAVRAYAVTLALRDIGYSSELIVFCDDMDGLRRVPANLPPWLKEHVLRPVSNVPDPLGNFGSFAERMTTMLREALDEAGLDYRFMSGREAYRTGLLADQIRKVLLSWRRIGETIREMTGQEKYTKVLPYFPICRGCGRIYTAEAYSFDAERGSVKYRCVGTQLKSGWFDGCGYEGEASVYTDDGKLAWKTEFAARWAALDIRFEAYGKDIADSVKVNDWVSENVLGHPHPYHVRYEMFLDAVGRKISKSTGNVFTPQMWYRYASPPSLTLFLLKRSVGTRRISPSTIIRIMDEIDKLEELYFRTKHVTDFKTVKLRGLYEYANLLKPKSRPSVRIPYRLLIDLISLAPPEKRNEFVVERLRRYGYEVDSEDARKRIWYATNYVNDFGMTARPSKVEVPDDVMSVIRELVEVVRRGAGPEEIQSEVFNRSRARGINPADVFRYFYRVLLNRDSGPRLGPYLYDLGPARLEEILSQYAPGTGSKGG